MREVRRGAGCLAGLLVAGAVVLGSSATGEARERQAGPLDGPPLCSVAEGDGPAEDDGTVRIATYNILHSLDEEADATMDQRVELVTDALANSGADVIGLQEVVASARHGLVVERIAQGLAARTGDTWHWCFNRSNPHVPGEPDIGPGGVGGPLSALASRAARAGDSPWSEGVAVVSRYPIVDQAAHRLPTRVAEVPTCVIENLDDLLAGPTCLLDTRQVLWTRVDTPCGAMDFVTTHLAHHLSSLTPATQLAQVQDALARIDAWATADALPDVYVGDFNTEEGSPVHQSVLESGFVDAFRAAEPDALGATSSQDLLTAESTVSRRIDYVFARAGNTALDPTDGQVIGNEPAPLAGGDPSQVVWPSDHYGVAVGLTAPGACATAADTPTASRDSESSAQGVGSDELPATGGTTQSLPSLVLLAAATTALVARSTLKDAGR